MSETPEAKRARMAKHAENVRQFEAALKARFGARIKELDDERGRIEAEQADLDKRRTALREAYAELNAERRREGMHKYPDPPPAPAEE